MGELESLSGTPAAHQARAVRERISGCSELFAHCPPEDAGCSLVASLQCHPEGAVATRVREARGADHWLLVTPGDRGERLVVRGSELTTGGVRLSVRVPRSLGDGAAGLLLPARGDAGPSRLSDQQAILHARVRPDRGLAVAGLVADDGWADRLFGLRDELFLGAVLAGRWELAVYPPAPGELIPPLALAVDVRSRQRAISAMEGFLEEIQTRWPVQRTPWDLAGDPGACLGDLRLLPELAPCYVATPEALVLGWNARSVRHALDGRLAETLGGSHLRLFLDRLPATDEVLRASFDERLGSSSRGNGDGPATYPWQHLEVRGERRGGFYHLDLELTR